MDKFRLIKELIPEIEEYAASFNGDLSRDGFARFLFEKGLKEKILAPEPKEETRRGRHRSVETEVARLVSIMNRYARIYFKLMLDGEENQNMDELVMMIILLDKGRISKSELIHFSMQEKTTGMEILKRMEHNGFIQSMENPLDKRSRLVEISKKGEGFMWKMFIKIGPVAKLVTGNLNEEEKSILLNLLTKLDNFHKPIYENGEQKKWLGYE